MRDGKIWKIKLQSEGSNGPPLLLEGQSLEQLCRDNKDLLAKHDPRPAAQGPVEVRAARCLVRLGKWSCFEVVQRGVLGRKAKRHEASPELLALRQVAPLLNINEVAKQAGLKPYHLQDNINGRLKSLTAEQWRSIKKVLGKITAVVSKY